MKKLKRAPWELTDGSWIDLIQPAELTKLPDGIVLRSIFGETVTKGVDEINDDTRGGFLAYGLPSDGKVQVVYEVQD
jgi:hypothetical protein